MKSKFNVLFIAFLLASCSGIFLGDDPKNTAVDTFNQFWHGVDETWPEFATKKVNWDSVYQIYRPKADTVKSDKGLKLVMSGTLTALKDKHTTIYPKDGGAIGYFPPYPANFYGISWIVPRYMSNYKNNTIVGYGKMGPDVGYIIVSRFDSSSDKYDIIDNIISEYQGMKGIIIDVRNNTGGSSTNSEKIASRFASQERTYAYVRFRTSESRTDMSDYVAQTLSPGGAKQFKGKVAVLTNQGSYSATEHFILMMKSTGIVAQVGDNTGGGSGTRPFYKELPNGWTYRVSSMLLCDVNKVPITIGIVPEIKSSTTKADSLAGKDTIIEAALTFIRN